MKILSVLTVIEGILNIISYFNPVPLIAGIMMLLWMKEDNAKTRGYLVYSQLILLVNYVLVFIIFLIMIIVNTIAVKTYTGPEFHEFGDPVSPEVFSVYTPGVIKFVLIPNFIGFVLNIHYYMVAKKLKANMA